MAKRSVAPEVNDNTAIPISVARDRLSELAEDVLMRRADRVALSHKPYNEHLVLMRASDLAKMEADLAALQNVTGLEPRPLRGMATIHGDPEEVLTEVRRRQAILWEAKLKSFSAPEEVESDE